MDFAKPGFIWGVRPTTQKSRLPLIACEVAEDPTPENANSPRPKKKGTIFRLGTSSPGQNGPIPPFLEIFSKKTLFRK